MSKKMLEEAYGLLDPKEQGVIQEMHGYYEKISDLGDGLSEEGQMVFDMIIEMPVKEGEDALEGIGGKSKIEDLEKTSLDLNSLLGIDG